jgi:DNA polymerase-3 subunit gamma/tau
MLTKEAFNALLKTLEEPPAHVIFILATTEEEKLLDTILSRCQVFRFRSPSRAVLSEAVIGVAAKEGFKLSTDAADLIAIAADGSFRDALGITQKVLLASGDEIGTADEVATIIGAPKTTVLLNLLDALQTKSVKEALLAIRQAVDSHVEPKFFHRLLLEEVRAVMLLRNDPGLRDVVLGSFGDSVRQALQGYAAMPITALNSHLLTKLLKASDESARSPLPYLPLEILVIEHCGGE